MSFIEIIPRHWQPIVPDLDPDYEDDDYDDYE